MTELQKNIISRLGNNLDRIDRNCTSIAYALGANRSTVAAALARLVEQGEVAKDGTLYYLAGNQEPKTVEPSPLCPPASPPAAASEAHQKAQRLVEISDAVAALHAERREILEWMKYLC